MEKISPAPGEVLSEQVSAWLLPHLDLGAAAPRLPAPASHSIIAGSMRHCVLTQFLSCPYSLLTFPSLPATVKEENGKTCKALASAQRRGVPCLLCLTRCKPPLSGCSSSC